MVRPTVVHTLHTHTSIKVAREPLACRAGEAGGWASNQGARLAGLGLSTSTVPELRTQDKKATRRGRFNC